MSETKNAAPVKKEQSNIAYRVIAAVVAVACVVTFFLPFTIFAGSPSGGLVTAEKKLFQLFELMPDAPYKLFGFIPMFADPKGVLGCASGLVSYVLIAALVVAFVFAVLAIVLGKKSQLFAFLATVVYTWGAALYMIAVVSISCYLPMKIIFDASAILMSALGTLAFFAVLYAKLRKASVLNSARFLLTLGFTVCLFLAVTYNHGLVSDLIGTKKIYKIALLIAIGLTLVNVIFATVRAYRIKAFAFDFINAVAELVIAGALIIVSVISPVLDKALLLYSCIAATIGVILFALTFLEVKVEQKKAAAVAAALAALEAQRETEEKIAAAVAAVEPPVEDYFEGRITDAFIQTLNLEERNQFAAMYLLRHKDIMSDVPAYIIGGDNNAFFEMVLISLGEYRDEIPDSLLEKMYDYFSANYPQPELPVFEDEE